eukprot:3950146-Amphidinium_carterae.1
MCGMRSWIWMDQWFAQKHRVPNFPRVATPGFNPDTDFIYTGSAIGVTHDDEAEGPAIIDLLNPARGPTTQPRLNPGNVEALQNNLTTARSRLEITTDMLKELLQQSVVDPRVALQNLMEGWPIVDAPDARTPTPAVAQTPTPAVAQAPTPIVTETPINTSSCATSVREESLVKITELKTPDKPKKELSPHAYMNKVYAAELKKRWTGENAEQYRLDVFCKQAGGNQPLTINLMCFRCLGEIENDPKQYCHSKNELKPSTSFRTMVMRMQNSHKHTVKYLNTVGQNCRLVL